MNRRNFLKASGASALAVVTSGHAGSDMKNNRPNILLVITDQQFADVMSCVIGKKHLHTPHMDALAAEGMRFTRAYSPNPLCVPMRTSMIVGLYPHQTCVQTNSDKGKFSEENKTFMGKIFADAGYETAYFGKWHIPLKPSHKDVHGFNTFMERECRLDPEPAAAFIKQKHDKPFFAVASFLSPHEICEWSRKQNLPGGSIGDPPPLAERPPMLANSQPPENETDIMTHMRKSNQAHRLFPVGNYTEDDWRRHIWGYYRLVERADRFLGVLMDALRSSGQEKNTVVVFVSDHGDCHGAHKWNQKTVFYDESSRVPLIISRKGITPRGTADLLVNTGVDLIPTLCAFAGIKPPKGLPGMSLDGVALGEKALKEREYVVSQNHMVQNVPVDGKHPQPYGRMVRSEHYKYCLYSEGERRESLVDMNKDPGEMTNQAGNPEFADILKQHRGFLREFANKHNDKRAVEMLEHVEKES